MGTRPPGGQHVEQLFLDFVAGIAGGASTNQLDGTGVRSPAHRQPVHLSQLAVRAEQGEKSRNAALH